MILHEEKNGNLELDNQVPCIIWRPLDFMNSREFRDLLERGINEFKKKKSTYPELKWLCDTRKLKVVAKSDLDWANEYINAKAFELNLQFVAFVLPENIFGKMATKIYIETTMKRKDNIMTIKTFSKYEEAKIWLAQCEVPVSQ